jgi:hypothetical protein
VVDTAIAPLSAEERAELAARSSQILFYQRTLALLTSERNLFTRDLLVSKGLDPAKQYSIDAESGELTEVPDG